MTDQLLVGDESASEPIIGRAMDSDGATFPARIAESVIARANEQISQEKWPTATYRLQFHRQFTFRDATAILDYLQQLGVSHIYASPYLKARSGSVHGYDIVDHNALNPEIGTEDDFTQFVKDLRRRGMGHILDVVPNHMGIGTDENAWWQDVLENGPSSPYAQFFDIDWSPLKTDLKTKVLLPVLSDQFGHVLERGELRLGFSEGTLFLNYHDRRFPIAPGTFAQLLRYRIEELQNRLGMEDVHFLEYQSILTAIGHLPTRETTETDKLIERQREKEVIKRRIARLCDESAVVARFVAENVIIFNGRPGEPHSFDLLDGLLQNQAYRLSYWRVAADEVNYRRFFDVNELAAVCMERPDVFEKAHALVFRLLDEGLLDGLRIDHADGLFDPTSYLWQLQQRRFLQRCRRTFDALLSEDALSIGETQWSQVEPLLLEYFARLRTDSSSARATRALFLVVEKILEGNERLPTDWPVHGTTGYEFVNQLNGVFVSRDNARTMDSVYTKFIGSRANFSEIVYNSKKLIMKFSMSSELNVLGHQLDRISERKRTCRDFTLNGLTYALREVVALFPIYRTYATPTGVQDRDRQYIEQAVAAAKRRNPSVSHAVFDFVRDVLLLRGLQELSPEEQAEHLRFLGRFQQFTGPMMAKAVEDTSFYTYNRLVSLNEVGGDPGKFGRTVAEFHQANTERQSAYPYGLTATSTHDTKRGEDVRARINVLSELPVVWRQRVLAWTRWNKRKKIRIDAELAPSRNDEYLLYQTLIGTWPFESPRGPDLSEYIERIQQYMQKATREAKVHTSWIAPFEPYEQATRDFIAAILLDEPLSAFRQDFEPFAAKIANLGIWNSLSQTVLKLTSPGVPDLYQGNEIWDFSLVDPDNRRPVDFGLRRRLLEDLSEANNPHALSQLLAAAPDGRIKMLVAQRCLQLRRQHPNLFTVGDYIPLEVSGDKSEHVCAFARREREIVAIVVVPRLVAKLLGEREGPPVSADVWGNTIVRLPSNLVGQYRELFSGRNVVFGESVLLAELLQMFPVGIFRTVN
jgi:(1->4)-alpha-D-glucan 1-alpha-D-glucosylmutase